MTKVKEDYIVGLDIGTDSCGWVAMNSNNDILKLQGKTAIGSRLFESGKSAAERRLFRTTHRRIKRRRWRLKLLEEFFDPYMAKVDPYFFARLKDSGLSPLDKRKNVFSIVFPTAAEDKKFYDDYPTIYHLRYKLMTEDEKFDLREVYLAIHHIIKYRGNFLYNTSVKDFKASKIDVKSSIEKLNKLYDKLALDLNVEFNISNTAEIEKVIKDKQIFKRDKVKKIAALFAIKTDNKEQSKRIKDIFKQVANAVLGYKTRFDTIALKEISKDELSDWNFKLSDIDADSKFEALMGNLDENEQAILLTIKELFNEVTLNGIVEDGNTLSESMIKKYNDHRDDLKLLKEVIDNHIDRKKAKELALAYDLYVNNRHGQLLQAKKKLGKIKPGSKEDFYKVVNKNLDDSQASKEIKKKIELDSFMPKQRTNANGVIPYQLHQLELDKIIENQSKYYPFLKELNPVSSHLKEVPYKLDELIRFRVPYYVGPLISPNESTKDIQTKKNQNFAWMIRKEEGRITPWNFDQKVNRIESANKFIKRMTTKDTYLFGEDVLPANSLLYQKFTVLNELNNIRINGKRISVDLKQEIYENLFKKHTTVTVKKLENYLKENHNLVKVEIKGLADEKKFNSGLTTYNRFKNLNIFDNQIDDLKYRNDFEKIIEWSTIFEDKSIYKEKLRSIDWLNEKQINALSNIRLQGWGRLSKKLLAQLHDHNGQTIIEQLWDSQNNFMQIVTQADFKDAIAKANQNLLVATSVEDILNDAYTSPANKKAIRQVIKVVDDIVKAASGKVPKQIAIEFTRDADDNPKRSQTRGSKLQKVYKDLSTELASKAIAEELNEAIKDKKLVQDKYYLYFMQLGRDAYTGEPINIDEIQKYDIDHILPQSFIKDDALDNRVLVSKAVNNGKSDNVPVKLFGNEMAGNLGITIRKMWEEWKNIGLISKTKYNNLLTDPDHINKYESAGFIRRQLVETSQIIKLVSTILQSRYPNTEIITVKAKYNHYLREKFDLYKSREVNDYHHAIDAYLSAICGNLLYQNYPNLRPFFVYGQYKKFSSDPDKEKEIFNKTRKFSFISQILKNKSENSKEIAEKLKRAYQFKYMLVSRETETKDQEMFKMTVFPRETPGNLIPKKKGMATEIYGGYTKNSDAYMVIVKIDKKKETEYRILGIPTRELVNLKKAEKEDHYESYLKEILAPRILYNKNGKRDKKITSFEIVKSKIPYKQVIQDGDKKFMLGSSTYVYNAKQLTLSTESMKAITNNFDKDSDENDALIKAYDEILDKVDKYLPLFDINAFRKKLHSGREKFVELSLEDKKDIILKVLIGLHDNPATSDLKTLGFSSTELGKMQKNSGIVLSGNAKLIYQSPTGLFKKSVKISDL
ncbi:type II CRISPR RNA-guided endonuclease Cas9 [Lactobacillus johnsonii]|uniref:type II CRISPR RNA-guided endonuclease Cas9 n=1 Tax=Lactobacillus johnsonii TaxID=33959 RepID=UPI0028E2384E|nr:type II CRISPR RNA-guided endonuclease Cas9 [Lactobacillus johnsonii]MDT9605912.1 type II CRISPR RNA-guided endonuclease Cas9 [Lactobacillus johnsonii]